MTQQHISTPPHSTHAEEAVLGALMLDNEGIDRVGDLKAQHFYRPENGVIFRLIQSLIAQNRPADVVTISDLAAARNERLDLSYLHALATNTPSAANVSRYAEIVRDKALQRGMLLAADAVHDIVQGPLSTAEKLDAAQAEFGKLAETTTRKEPASIQEAMMRYVDILDDRVHGRAPNPGIPTGLPDLDKILNGGIRRGALVTLGARPSMGKSAFGETVALNAALDGYSAMFMSMEMPESEVVERAVASVGKVSAGALARGDRGLELNDGWTRVSHAVKAMSETKLFIDDEPGLSLLQVVTKARAIKRKHGLDLLVIDYLQLMTGTEEKRYLQIEAITKGLKILAKELSIAVLALSQFSREIEKRPNKRPIPSDFRDGGSIEQDSDILLGLYREEQDKPDEQSLKGFAELFIMKNRQGRTGKINLKYIGEHMRFEHFTGPVPESPVPQQQRRGFRD